MEINTILKCHKMDMEITSIFKLCCAVKYYNKVLNFEGLQKSWKGTTINSAQKCVTTITIWTLYHSRL